MKKIFILSLSFVMSLSCFAYYGDYSSPSLELPGWFTFTGFIMIVGGILDVILFFKIWGMTNNIKALKKDHFNETVFENEYIMAKYLRKNVILGNLESVKQTLLKKFIDNVEQGFIDMEYQKRMGVPIGTPEYNNAHERALKETIAPYIDSLIHQYNKIGEEVPAYITKMKTFEDYFTLFVSDDLIVEAKKQE